MNCLNFSNWLSLLYGINIENYTKPVFDSVWTNRTSRLTGVPPGRTQHYARPPPVGIPRPSRTTPVVTGTWDRSPWGPGRKTTGVRPETTGTVGGVPVPRIPRSCVGGGSGVRGGSGRRGPLENHGRTHRDPDFTPAHHRWTVSLPPPVSSRLHDPTGCFLGDHSPPSPSLTPRLRSSPRGPLGLWIPS